MPLVALFRNTLEDSTHIAVQTGRLNFSLPNLTRIVGCKLGAE